MNRTWISEWLHIWAPMLALCTRERDHEPDWCEVIARARGWAPLVVGEKMTVRMGGRTYEITRKADDQ